MRAIDLKTEYLTDPVGIDVPAPRLYWHGADGIRQTAYRILARRDTGETVWDSGKTESGSMTHIPYGGAPLASRDRILWRVKLWDESGAEGDWSETAFFEMGLLHPSDWRAKWIAGDYRVNPRKRYPADCFAKTFAANNVVKARLYATACGVYEARLNGARVGDFILAPGVTDYRKRVQYQTCDVLPLLREGENTLTLTLADGWYRGSVGAWGVRNAYGTQTKLLCQLELTHADGTATVIGSDGAFAWSSDGPIRFADNQDGEIVDARRSPSYAGRARKTRHGVVPTASNNVPIREHTRFKPRIITTPGGKTVLDFGQNIAGYIAFHLNADAGQRVFLRFGEMLDENGEFTQKNIQCSTRHVATPLQQVEYLCRAGENAYKTRFAIFGFQYVLVETDVPFSADDFTAVAVCSAFAQAGAFECSNPLLNQFVQNTLWSTRNNAADIPTDCPTRERHGWTGDAQIFFRTAGYLFDYAAFTKKYLRDVYDWQKKSGRLPQIAPAGGVDFYMWPMNGSVGWSDAGVLLPYRFWKRYGDKRILSEHYAGMKRYARFMMRRCGKWGGPFAKPLRLRGKAKRFAVNRGQSFGEWAEPADVQRMQWTDFAAPHPEVSTAYTAYVMAVMEEIAQTLGHDADAALYRQYKEGCTLAYQAMAETPRFSLDTDRQARLVRPLAFGLLNEKQTAFAKTRLIQALTNYGWRVGTGFLSTPLILDVLAGYDLPAAYRLLENEEMPGWLFMPKNGATTVWESWEGTKAQGGVASLNHYSKGAVCEWLFHTMCGVRVAGENRFVIAPRPGGTLTFAQAEYASIYGTMKSRWEKKDGKTVYSISVPPNTTAEILLPDEPSRQVSAGCYEWEQQNQKQEG